MSFSKEFSSSFSQSSSELKNSKFANFIMDGICSFVSSVSQSESLDELITSKSMFVMASSSASSMCLSYIFGLKLFTILGPILLIITLAASAYKSYKCVGDVINFVKNDPLLFIGIVSLLLVSILFFTLKRKKLKQKTN